GDALDGGRHAGSGQRLPTTEGSQAASNVAGRSGSSPQQRLTRRPCSPGHRRLTSISAATASQCSTKRRDILKYRSVISLVAGSLDKRRFKGMECTAIGTIHRPTDLIFVMARGVLTVKPSSAK